jgi:hypothetical protein
MEKIFHGYVVQIIDLNFVRNVIIQNGTNQGKEPEVNGKFNVEEIRKQAQLRREEIRAVFGKPENELSHNDFIDMALQKHRMFKAVYLELFYENPSHWMFSRLLPEDRARMVQIVTTRRMKCQNQA